MRTILLLVLGLAACAGDDGGSAGDDGGGDDGGGYDTARCLITGHYGALGTRIGSPMSGIPASLSIQLDAGPPRDQLYIKLNAGQGAFSGGLATGTYTITGADATFTNCGLCISIVADIVAGQGPTKFYAATAGSVTLTVTEPPVGTATDLQFTEVSLDGMPVPNGCDGSIDQIGFSI